MLNLKEAKQSAQGLLARARRWPPGAILFATWRGLSEHEASLRAASLAYYGLFSLFPLLLGLIAALSLFLDPLEVEQRLLGAAHDNLPGVEGVVTNNIRSIVRLRGALGAAAILGLLWSGSAVFGALTSILNRAWSVRYVPPFHVAIVRRMLLAIGVGVLLSLSITATAFSHLAMDLAAAREPAFGSLTSLLPRLLLQTGSVVSALGVLMLVYQFGTTAHVPWRDLWPGALLAGLLFELAKNAFVFYLRQFAQFQQVYGSLSSVIALLLWAYVSALILIIGAEFGAAISRHRRGEI